MSEVTIELVQAKQAELAAMIEKLQQPKSTTLRIPAAEIVLDPGEWYAGAVLNDDGTVKHHTIVVKTSNGGHDFDGAKAFAKEDGLSAPSDQEARLIVAHKGNHLDGMSWFWLSKVHSNPAYAWNCYLTSGDVDDNDRSAEGGAVAVRRVNP
jgi:hypothetical protein